MTKCWIPLVGSHGKIKVGFFDIFSPTRKTDQIYISNIFCNARSSKSERREIKHILKLKIVLYKI